MDRGNQKEEHSSKPNSPAQTTESSLQIRLRELRRAIIDGTYFVAGEAIAEKIIQYHLQQ